MFTILFLSFLFSFSFAWKGISKTKGRVDHNSKHLEVCQKYPATRRSFNSLLGVWKCGQTRSFVFNLLLEWFWLMVPFVVPFGHLRNVLSVRRFRVLHLLHSFCTRIHSLRKVRGLVEQVALPQRTSSSFLKQFFLPTHYLPYALLWRSRWSWP